MNILKKQEEIDIATKGKPGFPFVVRRGLLLSVIFAKYEPDKST